MSWFVGTRSTTEKLPEIKNKTKEKRGWSLLKSKVWDILQNPKSCPWAQVKISKYSFCLMKVEKEYKKYVNGTRIIHI